MSTDTVVNVLAVIVWFAWSQFTVALVAEVVGTVANRRVRSPVVPGARHAAAQLVSTILLVATTITVARPALALEPVPGPVVEQPLAAASDPPTDAPTARQPTRTVTVEPRDSWWRIAEEHLGDGLRWQELRTLNVGRTVGDGTVITATTEVIHPGWELVVPDDSAVERPMSAETWTVAAGDNLWDIADHTLTDANGHEPPPDELVDYWHELIDTNRDRLLDPDRPDHIPPDRSSNSPL